MIPGQYSQVGVETAAANFFRGAARFVNEPAPFIEPHHIGCETRVGQGCPFGTAGGSAGIDDQGQILGRVDVHGRCLGFGSGNHIVEKQVAGLVAGRLGDFSQQSAQKSFQPGQVGFYTADDHRFHVRSLDGFNRGGIKLRMIHTENRFGAGITQLIVQFTGRVDGVAGDTNSPGFQYAEKDGWIMGQVGKKNGHPVSFFNPLGNQKIGDAVGRVLDLGKCPGGIVEYGIHLVWKFFGRFIQKGVKGFFISGKFKRCAFGPLAAMPGFCCHFNLLNIVAPGGACHLMAGV